MKNKVVFYQPWGGLGDNLQFTTLPKLYSDVGVDFYVSKHNVYRNDEVYDLVWKENPYVKGVIDELPNVGSCKNENTEIIPYNIVSAAEMKHGFSGEGRYPDLYYQPKFIPELQETTIVDLGAHSLFKYGLSNYYNIEKLFDAIKNNIDFRNAVSLSFRRLNFDNIGVPCSKSMVIESLKHYADVLHSCRSYYCLYSGGNSLAAAIKHKYNSSLSINCFLHGTVNDHRKKSYFVFDNVNYIEIF